MENLTNSQDRPCKNRKKLKNTKIEKLPEFKESAKKYIILQFFFSKQSIIAKIPFFLNVGILAE